MMKWIFLIIITSVSVQIGAQNNIRQLSGTNKSVEKKQKGVNHQRVTKKKNEVDYVLYRNLVRKNTMTPVSVQIGAQNNTRQHSGTNKSVKLVLEHSDKKQKGVNHQRVTKKKNEVDYVLYRNLVRKNTWLVGQGEPITQEVAKHLPYYYRLSMKNAQGHWQHIEAMHGDTMTARHNQHTYIINTQYDEDVASVEWMDKLKQVTQWYITADMTGMRVAEERAYDANGDMIYGFIPIQNDSNHVTGSYIDAWGRPVDMMEREGNTYGSVVYITYDKYGGDYIIDFLDGEGMRKLNSNGVDQERTVYDEQMRPILRSSHNCIGDYCIDNWGNCGNRYEYAPDGKSYTITRVDADLCPMRMLENRTIGAEGTFIKCKVLLDEWGREKERIFLDENDQEDVTLSNIHRVVYEYYTDGRLKSKTMFDLNNHPLKNE